ncbi:sigma-70 family RNA polymerase sigma factor [Lysobacter niabensis]|uniref:sigma-70 family RNA polymerase sigma factor n=1 Tax=Agrilutibacter niabensis TaxID=380628 RepID=UPI00361F4564
MRIYDHFAPRVHRYFLGLNVTTAQAEELVQEAMLRVWRHATRFNAEQAALPTWLFRIARNLYVDTVRHQAHRVAFEERLALEQQEAPAESDNGPEAYSDYAELARAIDSLTAEQARLIRMSYLESKSHSEIAAELGLPLGTVKSALRRSFEKLKSALGPAP